MELINRLVHQAGYTYCWEEYFQGMLILERKRNKQSESLSLLILLDTDKFYKGKRAEKNNVMHKLGSLLNSSQDEFVVEEWYMHDSIINIMCLNTAAHGYC